MYMALKHILMDLRCHAWVFLPSRAERGQHMREHTEQVTGTDCQELIFFLNLLLHQAGHQHKQQLCENGSAEQPSVGILLAVS